jgi:N-methylhydantoinase B
MRVETPGGGGFGPAQLRSLEALAEDLMSEKLTRAAAERDYGKERVQLAAKLLPAWMSA